jgi:hypothetical protein
VAKIIELESLDSDPICTERLPSFLPYLVRALPRSKTESSSPTKPPEPPAAQRPLRSPACRSTLRRGNCGMEG